MEYRNLEYLLKEVAKNNIDYIILGEGISRAALLIQEGEYEGMVLKASKTTLSEGYVDEFWNSNDDDDQFYSEQQLLEKIYKNFTPEQIELVKDFLLFPVYQDFENKMAIYPFAEILANTDMPDRTSKPGAFYDSCIQEICENVDLDYMVFEYGEESISSLGLIQELFEPEGVFFSDMHNENLAIHDGKLKVIDYGMY